MNIDLKKDKYISQDNLIRLLSELKRDYEVFVPAKKDNQRFYRRYTEFTKEQINQIS